MMLEKLRFYCKAKWSFRVEPIYCDGGNFIIGQWWCTMVLIYDELAHTSNEEIILSLNGLR